MLITGVETFTTEYMTPVRLHSNDGDAGRGIEINPEWIALSDYRISYNGSRF
jgi:hypothetical protein